MKQNKMIFASALGLIAAAALSVAAVASLRAFGDAPAPAPPPEAPRASTPVPTPTTPRETATNMPTQDETPAADLPKTEEEWRKKLTPEQYHVVREKGTERAFTGKYWDHREDGVYRCVGCGEPLFDSTSKFDSECGWPSFDRPIGDGKEVKEEVDNSLYMTRTEVLCKKCNAHLGHVFDDGPTATGLRYCINSASIDFQKRKPTEPKPEAPKQP